MSAEYRQPRVRLLANGEAVAGVLDASIWSNNHLAADRFRVRLALSPGLLAQVDAPEVRLEVQLALDGAWTSLVVGEADCVSVDPLRRVADVEGRDLSALLIDSRVDETFANRTASEIAILLGGRHGLEVDATPTATLTGRYYQSEHDQLKLGQFSRALSEWDLLAYLAAREGFDLFMDGPVLRFGPRVAELEPVSLAVAECIDVRLEHALGIGRSIEVTVRSWDQRGAQAVVQTARGGGSGRSWKQSVVRPNLQADEAEALARRILADLVRHERTAMVRMPGELAISARSPVALSGTGTEWDRVYAVSAIQRRVDPRHGFTQSMMLQGAG